MDAWANHEWKKRWTRTADGAAATWNTPWEMSPLTLYDNLPKHQTTALMLLRTEVIGLNAWLASIHVPDIIPRCDCGWQAQAVRHVLLHCSKYEQQRTDLIRATGLEDLRVILTHVARRRHGGLFAVGSWINLRWPTKSSLRTSQNMPHSRH